MGALLFLTLPLFFYNLGEYSLVDFDEAWYAEIARNILKFHQPVLLIFNNQPYLDHPPIGFNLMALSFSLFGVNEFTARLPAALLGFGSVLLIYFLGRSLVSRWVGLSAALMLTSSVWFVYRAREADLDSPFLFFFLLCLLAAVKLKDNYQWLYVLAAALAALLQIKSLIGLTIIPSMAVLFLINKQRLKLTQVIIAITIFVSLLTPWLLMNYLDQGSRFLFRQWAIAFPADHRVLFSAKTLTYLHAGVGKWYYPALLAVPMAAFLLRRKLQVLALLPTTLLLLVGFLTNAKTEIWHLIPLYPLLFLLLSAVVFSFGFPRLMTLLVLAIAIFQIYNFRHNIRLTDRGNSDLVTVSLAARGRSEPLYLDGENFFPTAVFYSEKEVLSNKKAFPPPHNNLIGLISRAPRPFLLLTEDWRLRTDKIPASQYKLLSQSGSWTLIMVK